MLFYDNRFGPFWVGEVQDSSMCRHEFLVCTVIAFGSKI